MSHGTLSGTTTTSIPALCIRRFNSEEYAQIVRQGILPANGMVELMDGLLVLKAPSRAAPRVRVLLEPEGTSSPYPALPLYQFTVEQYHQLIAAGILREGEPVELLNGWPVVKMTRNPPHDVALSLAEYEIDRRLPPTWFRRVQSAVTTITGEPEPDLAIVRGPRRRYSNHHPSRQDLALVLEVAESSLRHDRTVKAEEFARDAIPVYWIINLVDRQVEVYTDPTGPDPQPAYRQRRDYGPTESVPLVLDGQVVASIPVADLLP